MRGRDMVGVVGNVSVTPAKTQEKEQVMKEVRDFVRPTSASEACIYRLASSLEKLAFRAADPRHGIRKIDAIYARGLASALGEAEILRHSHADSQRILDEVRFIAMHESRLTLGEEARANITFAARLLVEDRPLAEEVANAFIRQRSAYRNGDPATNIAARQNLGEQYQKIFDTFMAECDKARAAEPAPRLRG